MSLHEFILNELRDNIISKLRLNHNVPAIKYSDTHIARGLTFMLYPKYVKISITGDNIIVEKIILVDTEVNCKKHTSEFNLSDPRSFNNVIEYISLD